ncbi:MAG TPA: hypothetical protein ENJ33_06135 [Thiothrix sp.]|nr:hypothetical protein [Thiothrix sp.]
MPLSLILARERDILLKRRGGDVEDKAPIMHALDSDVFYDLCAKTDWATGTIGIQSAVSYARTALTLSENIPRKSKRALRVVTRKCVHNSVQRLIKAGLLLSDSESVKEGQQNRLVLIRVFWRKCLQASHHANNPDKRQMEAFIQTWIAHSRCSSATLAQHNAKKSTGRCRTDGTYKSNNIPNADFVEKFSLSLSWIPDERYVERFLQAGGFSASQIKQIWFGKYVQHWSQQPIQRTQREWSAHYANHMQSYLLRPNFFEKVNGMLEEHSTNEIPAKHRSAGLLTVPMIKDGTALQAWAIAHGLAAAPSGVDTMGYYRLLCQQVERMNVAKERIKYGKS